MCLCECIFSHTCICPTSPNKNSTQNTKLHLIMRLGFFYLMAYQPLSLFIVKATLLEEHSWNYSTHSSEKKWFRAFSKEHYCESERNSTTGVRTHLL